MIYGCIGERLSHSISREIHDMIGDYAYELREIAREDLEAFLGERSFKAINVAYPYQQAALPYLDGISDTARAIGAVDTIVRREGRLYGYNTEFDGLCGLMNHMGLALKGKKALVLGAGVSSRAALLALRAMGVAEVQRVSRDAREGALTSAEAALAHADVDVIVNTAPCGMSPGTDEAPLSLECFPRLSGVVDTACDPLRTRLVRRARAMGVPAEGGLYMRVAQSVRASEIFRDTRCPEGLTEEIYGKLLRRKENIVLIGMPGSGKSTVARIIGRHLARPVADVDARIQERAGMPITEIFARFGEPRFRDMESEVVAEFSAEHGLVIATGGGTILRQQNVDALRRNGRLFLLDRPLEALRPSEERPLGDTREKVERLYRERMPLYRAAADEIIPSGNAPEETALAIESR